jgi:hypothetical protein
MGYPSKKGSIYGIWPATHNWLTVNNKSPNGQRPTSVRGINRLFIIYPSRYRSTFMQDLPLIRKPAVFFPFLLLFFLQIQAQPITGVWKGKMGSAKVELKLVRKGDSLIGTSYYYDSKSNYRRYSVKGYFDDKNNDVIWWD